MKRGLIPLYAPDGTSLGNRSRDAAERLVASGSVNPAYGRKGHLKAIFLPEEDGTSSVELQPRLGIRYSYSQHLDNGYRCWTLKKLDSRTTV